MKTLKQLYSRGIIVKRQKCSNISLKPVVFTFTERISKPVVDFLDEWINHVVKPSVDEVPTCQNPV